MLLCRTIVGLRLFLAGPARVRLLQGDLAQAMALVEEVLASVEAEPIEGTDEPLDVYLTCYRVLRANGDRRARRVTRAAHALLQEKAAKISDEEMRLSFLENVPAHREITEAYAAA